MRDQFGRQIDYLRLSVTDYCNLQCRYCQDGPPQRLTHDACLRYEEMAAVVAAFVELGGRKVRITGGEPLLKPKLANLIALLSGLTDPPELSLTTNGVLLAAQAAELRAAGLSRVNVSLDTLRPTTFRQITGVDLLPDVLRGIAQVLKIGMKPLKINTVVLKGINDDEVLDLLQFAREHDAEIRFIEQMALPGCQLTPIDGKELRLKLVSTGHELVAVPPQPGDTAEYYIWQDQRVGFITTHMDHICQRCSRLRLSPDGKLRPCLFSAREVDIKNPLRNGEDIVSLLKGVIQGKPKRGIDEMSPALVRPMVNTGG